MFRPATSGRGPRLNAPSDWTATVWLPSDTVSAPDPSSPSVPVIVTVGVDSTAPSAGVAMVRTGGVVSRLTVSRRRGGVAGAIGGGGRQGLIRALGRDGLVGRAGEDAGERVRAREVRGHRPVVPAVRIGRRGQHGHDGRRGLVDLDRRLSAGAHPPGHVGGLARGREAAAIGRQRDGRGQGSRSDAGQRVGGGEGHGHRAVVPAPHVRGRRGGGGDDGIGLVDAERHARTRRVARLVGRGAGDHLSRTFGAHDHGRGAGLDARGAVGAGELHGDVALVPAAGVRDGRALGGDRGRRRVLQDRDRDRGPEGAAELDHHLVHTRDQRHRSRERSRSRARSAREVRRLQDRLPVQSDRSARRPALDRPQDVHARWRAGAERVRRHQDGRRGAGPGLLVLPGTEEGRVGQSRGSR